MDAAHTPGSGSSTPKGSDSKLGLERRSNSKEPEEAVDKSIPMDTLKLPGGDVEPAGDEESDKQVNRNVINMH